MPYLCLDELPGLFANNPLWSAKRKAVAEFRRSDFLGDPERPLADEVRPQSCGRYRLLEDGTIEYVFEFIPRADAYRNGYIGLFWASYIQAPERKSIHFRGRERGSDRPPTWIEAVTPQQLTLYFRNDTLAHADGDLAPATLVKPTSENTTPAAEGSSGPR